MQKAFIINAHQPYPFAEGNLNAAMVERMTRQLEAKGYEVRTTTMTAPYDPEEEVAKHTWADVVIVQTPCNWMGVPWSFKKYMDEVYSAGLSGDLCDGDGRSSDAPTENYGTGGRLMDTKYMLSVTFNAPREAFDNEADWFFGGASVDDLFRPAHLNFRFFGMTPLPTFSAHDVMKNPQVEADFARLDTHIDSHF